MKTVRYIGPSHQRLLEVFGTGQQYVLLSQNDTIQLADELADDLLAAGGAIVFQEVV